MHPSLTSCDASSLTSGDASIAHTMRCIHRANHAMHPSLSSCDASIAHIMLCIYRSHHAMHPSRKSCDASIAHIMRCINHSHHAMHPSLASCDASIAQIMRCIQKKYRQIRLTTRTREFQECWLVRWSVTDRFHASAASALKHKWIAIDHNRPLVWWLIW